MANFSKIYDHILDSTLWEESPETRLVYLGMTFASDLDGNLQTRTMSALARRLNLPESYVEKGLLPLTEPDPKSANTAYEGRRIVPVQGGWLVVSKPEYVKRQTAAQVQWAEKKAKWRAKRAGGSEAKDAARLGRLASREVKP